MLPHMQLPTRCSAGLSHHPLPAAARSRQNVLLTTLLLMLSFCVLLVVVVVVPAAGPLPDVWPHLQS